MLLGPYNTQGNIKVDTSKLLYDINEIATHVYNLNFIKAKHCHDKCHTNTIPKKIDDP